MAPTPAGRRLLATAAGLFYSHGINAVGVATIAEQAKVTKKTLYDCFGSKDGLVVAYLIQRHQDWRHALETRLATDEASPLTVFDSYLDHLRREPEVHGCGFINAAADLPATHRAMNVIRDHKTQVRHQLDALLPSRYDTATTSTRESTVTHLFYLLEGATVEAGLLRSLKPLETSRNLAQTLLSTAM
ncbi:TetR/AcrR family transcriptional regulator [Actinomadura vinacea]|uniref:TetR/AcrR family transcriptional regulator n=2 Tax=Actinomadura vinacea TaxID=115336 RepID=A0ABP5VWV6_9ACTN